MFLSDRRPWLGFLSRVGWCFAGGEEKCEAGLVPGCVCARSVTSKGWEVITAVPVTGEVLLKD